MHEDIRNERESRKERLNDLDDMLSQNADLASKFLDNFEKRASDEADKFMGDLETEMDNRFAHQDKLLGNMGQFITRFQQTLKIFGKDV